MSSQANSSRTAVLVVHGMGSQRPLDTVRGVVSAAWLDNDPPREKERKFWVHPHLGGTDIDLSVFTGSPVDGVARPDFHELYWAHLMSETKAIAVLLWLFELAKRGPRLNPRLVWVWKAATMFLAALILSLSFLGLHLIERISGFKEERQALILAPALLLVLVLGYTVYVAGKQGTYNFQKLAIDSLKPVLVGIGIVAVATLLIYYASFSFCQRGESYGLIEALKTFVTVFLPATIALAAVGFLLGRPGIRPFAFAYAFSFSAFAVYLAYLWLSGGRPLAPVCARNLPWSLDSTWTIVTAWTILGLYIGANAAFLQPYLGDAARYFRHSPANIAGQREIRKQAVETLKELHLSGRYDRIIVVAHSLGTVVAYDMLRAYFSRVYWCLPGAAPELREDIDAIENAGDDDVATLRRHARSLTKEVATMAGADASAAVNEEEARQARARSWLVTDFVTLGSPLAHAVYLTSQGHDPGPLDAPFELRKAERVYPTCPPVSTKDDKRLTYEPKDGGGRRFHHGALFGFTRWTNLYFPMSELLWGDAIGGPLAPVFGKGIVDIPVSTRDPAADDLFTHVTYWDVRRARERQAPHVQWLRQAIDLEDVDAILRGFVAGRIPQDPHALP